MSELNKDGLVPGQAVDFTTLMQTIRKKKGAEKNEPSAEKPKPAASRPKKPSVPNVLEAKESKEA